MIGASKKLLQAAAGTAAGGAGLDVSEVFSTYLYDGTGSALTVNNGIDLTEGGLVWLKSRTDNGIHTFYDTERGAQKVLSSNSTGAQGSDAGGGSTAGLYQFNSNGFSVGADWAGNGNNASNDYVSWTFRKAENFLMW